MSLKIRYERNLTQEDIASLATNIREVERDDILRSFDSVAEGLIACWGCSEFSRVIHVNDHPVAAFGVAKFDDIGVPWMLCTDLLSYAHPVTIVREARRAFEKMKTNYPVMANTVPAEDVEAHALLESLGFEIVREPLDVRGFPYFQFWYGRAS